MKACFRKSVMVFDRDPGMLLKCDLLLKKKGYDVYVSTHTDDIVGQVREHEPDIILMNSAMPGDAADAILKIKMCEPLRMIPVIRFSAKAHTEETAVHAVEAATRMSA